MWDLIVPGGNDHDFYIDLVTTAVLVHNCPIPGEGGTALDTTPAGRVYSAHYLNDTGAVRNIPGSVVDETIDYGQVAKDLPDRTVYYDPKNDVTVVESKTTGKIMSVRRGSP